MSDTSSGDEPPERLLQGALHKVDCESLNSLVQEYDKALNDNFDKEKQHQKLRDDYVKLKNRLKTLPDRLEYDAMVPLCSKALCPGKIVHTNEILVLLGENTFVECSAKDACDIVAHRVKKIDETLNKVGKERELFNAWKVEAERQMVETLGDGTIEIMEDYDEEKEKEWKKNHRESVRRYHQQLAKDKGKNGPTPAVVNNKGMNKEEERLWNRLDALELEEEFMEAQAVYEERMNENKNNVNSNEMCTAKIREKSHMTLADLLDLDNREFESANTPSSGKKVTFSPENIIHNLTDLKGKESSKKRKESDSPEEIELYKSSELCENGLQDPIFIRFKHGEETQEDGHGEEDLVSSSDSDSSDEEENYQIVSSPGDIYDQFGPPSLESKAIPGADKTPLKSILKPRVSKENKEKSSVNSQKKGTTFTNASFKKALCETASVIADTVEERKTNSTNDKNHEADSTLPNKITLSSNNVIVQDAPTANANKSAATQEVKSGRPLSLFKRMKSGERAFSEDGTN